MIYEASSNGRNIWGETMNDEIIYGMTMKSGRVYLSCCHCTVVSSRIELF